MQSPLRLASLAFMLAVLLGALADAASARERSPDAATEAESAARSGPTPATGPQGQPGPRQLKDILDGFQIHVGFESAGPVLFTDSADARLERTTVFELGGRLALFLGQETLDLHRFGVGLAFDSAAVSDARALRFLTPQLLYEIGHPLILQLGVGWAAGLGTDGFADRYSGAYAGAALRYSFRRREHTSPLSVSLGLAGRMVASAGALERSSAFVGAQVELIFHKMPSGGVR